MTLNDFILSTSDEKLINSLKRSVKEPKDFDVLDSNYVKNFLEIDVRGIKSKAKAKIRVEV